jgi:hypothetical protein
MYRKKTSNPTIYGGNVESEVMYGAKRRKRAAKKHKTSKSKGFCIRAASPGINKTKRPRNKPHKF